MIRVIANRCIVLACLAVSSASAGTVRADERLDIDIEEIIRRVTQWRSSFINLRVGWELRSSPETRDAVEEWPPPNPDSGSLFCRKEWIWADHGLDLIEDRSFFYEDGSSREHDIEAFNGPKGVVFRALFHKPPAGPEEFKTLRLRGLGVGKPISPIQRTPLSGLYWPGDAAWLPDILTKWKWKLEKIENAGGEPCARIVVTLNDLVDTLWLSISHDCLVRRHRVENLSHQRAGFDLIVDEFQRLDSDLWFPKRGRIQLRPIARDGASVANENQIFVVTNAAVNQPLDLSRFDPPTPAAGTVVDDHGRSYRHGVSTGAPDQSTATMANGQSLSSAPSAAPPNSGWFWSASLVGISILLLTIGLWFSRRTKEGPS